MAFKGKLVLVNVPVKKPSQAVAYYEGLFGIKFARSFTSHVESYHAPISSRGPFMSVQERFEDEPITCYFGVQDLEKAIEDLKKAGGKLRGEILDIPIAPEMLDVYKELHKKAFGVAESKKITPTMGRAVEVADADGNRFGLMELADHAHAQFKFGKHRKPLSKKYAAAHADTVKVGKKIFAATR